jgi:hypothetical protein
MVKVHRLVTVVLALGAIAAPAQAQASFGPEARFDVTVPAGQEPTAVHDVAIDADGSVFMLWSGLVQKYDSSGALVKSWGGHGSAPGQFFPPDKWGRSTDQIEVDGLGHVYVTDYYGNRVVKFTTNGDFVANLGANGGDGTAGRGPGEFYRPDQLVTDAAGNLYVRDSPQFLPSLSAPQLQKLAPDGAVLARRASTFLPYGLTPGPGDRWYAYPGRQQISTLTEQDLVTERAIQPAGFPVLPGDPPGTKGYITPSCCGIAFVGGRVWIGRSEIHAIEAYGPNGGFQIECPVTGNIRTLAPGRDGRLYALAGTSVIRYGENAQPCDTEAPRITSPVISPPILHTSNAKRMRRTWLSFGVSEQATAELTFTRLVKGRRVNGHCVRARPRNRSGRSCVLRRMNEATFRGIPAYANNNPWIRLADLLAHKRLPHGRYKLRIGVVDHAGLRSRPAVLPLLISR